MENYIVRIYRRDEEDCGKVTGVIESVEHDTRHTFHTLNSLRSILMQASNRDGRNTVSTDNNSLEPQPALSALLN